MQIGKFSFSFGFRSFFYYIKIAKNVANLALKFSPSTITVRAYRSFAPELCSECGQHRRGMFYGKFTLPAGRSEARPGVGVVFLRTRSRRNVAEGWVGRAAQQREARPGVGVVFPRTHSRQTVSKGGAGSAAGSKD